MSKNSKNQNTNNGGNNSSVAQNLITLVTGKNPDYTAPSEDKLVEDIISEKVKVLPKSQKAIGISAYLEDDTKAVVTYEDKGGNILAKVNFAPVFVGKKRRVQIGAAAANSGKTPVGQGKGKPNQAKPQPKTYGKQQNNQARKAGSAAMTGAAATTQAGVELEKFGEQVARAVLGNPDMARNIVNAVFGTGEKKAKDESKKDKKSKAKTREITKEEYEELLLREFLRLNDKEAVENGLKNVKVPKRTIDGSEWNLVGRTRMVWTFQKKGDPDMEIDISILDVQTAMEVKNWK